MGKGKEAKVAISCRIDADLDRVITFIAENMMTTPGVILNECAMLGLDVLRQKNEIVGLIFDKYQKQLDEAKKKSNGR